jgi:hypothetical protein
MLLYSSLSSFLQSPIISSHFGPNILLSTLFSNTVSQRPSVTPISNYRQNVLSSTIHWIRWAGWCNGNSVLGKSSAGCNHYLQTSTGMVHSIRTNVLLPNFQLVIVYNLLVSFVTDLIYRDNLERATSSRARKLLVCYCRFVIMLLPRHFSTSQGHFRIVGGRVHIGSTRHVGHYWLIVPAPDDCDDGEFVGMKIGRETEVLGEKLTRSSSSFFFPLALQPQWA